MDNPLSLSCVRSNIFRSSAQTWRLSGTGRLKPVEVSISLDNFCCIWVTFVRSDRVWTTAKYNKIALNPVGDSGNAVCFSNFASISSGSGITSALALW